MSFWEDRFVYRPHASAAPGGSSSDGTDQPSSGESEVGRAWSYVPDEPASTDDEPGQTFGFSAPDDLDEDDADAHAEVESDESHEADEQGAETVEEPEWEHDDEVAALAEADEAPVEHKRRGLFRRKKPMAVEVVAEEAVEDEVLAVE